MTETIAERLEKLGVTLPSPAAPVANYVPFVRTGSQLFISGQLPMNADGIAYTGQLVQDVSIEDAQQAAKLCAINILAQARAALDGDLEKIVRVVKLGAFVNAPAGFGEHASVVNGASDFMVAALGDRGRHARSAVGSSSLPFNVPVEIDAIIEVA